MAKKTAQSVEERKREMIDENANTADLTINEKLDRILAELSDMNEDTGDVVMRLDRIESRLEALAIDVAEVRAAQQRTDEPGDTK